MILTNSVYDKENIRKGSKSVNNPIRADPDVAVDFTTLKISNKQADRSANHQNATNSQSNSDESKIRNKTKGRSNSVRPLHSKQHLPQQQSRPQYAIDDSRIINDGKKHPYPNQLYNNNNSRAAPNSVYSNNNILNGNAFSGDNIYRQYSTPYLGGHSNRAYIPQQYIYNNTNGGQYLHPHQEPKYPIVEIHLTPKDHEFAANQMNQPSSFGRFEPDMELQKRLAQTIAETNEMLSDQRDNFYQFYESMKQAQIANWLSSQTLEEQKLYLDRTRTSILPPTAASVC